MTETQELASKIYILWCADETKLAKEQKKPFTEEDLKGDFCYEVLKKKLTVFNVPIEVNAYLYSILSLCAYGNPGVVQLLMIDILKNIYERKGKISKGYKITSDDFAFTFETMPSMDKKEIEEEYHKKWDEQKIPRKNAFEVDNKVDTQEYWLSFFE